MYISEISIENYRSFKKSNILFTPGLNVLTGHNNAGKTNVIKALQLIFDRTTRSRLTIDDFNSGYSDFSTPPKIEIKVTISEHVGKEDEDDKSVIYEWLTEENEPYKACLTFIFALPHKHHDDYVAEIARHKDGQGVYKKAECFKLLEKKYLQKYIANIYGGNPEKQEKADTDSLDRFDFQFLDAIRDAERQMFYGNNTLLRDVLNYFLDYDLTKGQGFEELSPESRAELHGREAEFNTKSVTLLEHLIGRISKSEILEYSEKTGAAKGGKPDFDAEISEQALLFALRLIVEKQGFKLPIKNNGLGYNNLLFIALILAKIQMERSSVMGDNAKVFPILAIEEPEAHLHPSMQYKFLKFLDSNLNTQKQARQVFISSHSTHIASAVELDSIICLYEDADHNQLVGYPGRVFSNSEEYQESKRYVKRFLDATKSNLLFAERIILVEGLAEQLLLPCFAAYIGKEEELLSSHTAIVSVDGRTFKHFLKLFVHHPDTSPYGIKKKVVCITDADPAFKEKEAEEEGASIRWRKCYPFQLNMLPDTHDYKPLASHAVDLKQLEAHSTHIKIFTPDSGRGKTLEYELALYNPGNDMLLTESFPSTGKNKKDFFKEVMKYHREDKTLQELMDHSRHEEIKGLINGSNWEESDKRNAFIAALYHQAIENTKGEHAFHLESQLRINLAKPEDQRSGFTIPPYIIESINFITN